MCEGGGDGGRVAGVGQDLLVQVERFSRFQNRCNPDGLHLSNTPSSDTTNPYRSYIDSTGSGLILREDRTSRK